ncbi:unnamed protein product [marine sediment metagenome]|uniref:Uncharacterized protein n=1 Tax=marine sediment metagenome TaxID=412755 RepID=X1DDJ0_9ZZZZ
MFFSRMWFRKRLKIKKNHEKFLKKERNRRYYERHRDEILKNRQERYQESKYL